MTFYEPVMFGYDHTYWRNSVVGVIGQDNNSHLECVFLVILKGFQKQNVIIEYMELNDSVS